MILTEFDDSNGQNSASCLTASHKLDGPKLDEAKIRQAIHNVHGYDNRPCPVRQVFASRRQC